MVRNAVGNYPGKTQDFVTTARITISSTDNGSVVVPGEGQFLRPVGTELAVEAQAEEPFSFVGWSGTAVDAGLVADPTAAATTVVLKGDTTLQAIFKIKIIWVSFHGTDAATANAATAGFTDAPDKGYTDLLADAGYEVVRYVQTGTPDVNVLNAAALVILSRSVASGSFQNANADNWNTKITAPMIITNGYLTRKSRLGFMTGSTIPDSTGDISLTVNDPTHPIFAGIPLTCGTMNNPFAGITVYPDGTTVARGISIITEAANAEGKVLATVSAASAATGPAGATMIAEWPAGATLTHDGGAGTNVLAGRRMVFLTGSREASGKNSEGTGMIDLTADGAQMFLNTVQYMIAPPGTPNLVHSYTFDDGTAKDSVGTADGTLVGGAAIVDGALITTAQDQWMEMSGAAIAMNTLSEVTIEAWYTPTAGANTSWSMLAYFGDSVNGLGSNGLFMTTARGDNKSRAAISIGDIATPWASESGADGPEYDDGQLHYMVATFSATHVNLYIDGILYGHTALSAANQLSALSQNFAYLAKGGYGGDPEWIGAIHEFNIYDKALSLAQIRANYEKGLGLVHQYTFEDGTANDSVGKADGTLVGDAVIMDGALVTIAQDAWMEMSGSAIAMNTFNEVTIEAWYTPEIEGNPSWSMLAYFGDSVNGLGSNGFFMTSARGDDKSRAAISIGDIATPWASESGADGPEYDNGLLHHMVATINATDITLFIDGVQISTTPLSETNKISGISQNFAYLAKGGYGGDPEWIGQIHEFNIYNTTLSPVAVAARFKMGAVNSLVHQYTFDDGTADDSIDSANGTLVGGAKVENGALVTTAQDQWMEMSGAAIAMNTYPEVTIEAWYTPTANANTGWSMLAYFGDSVNGLGSNGFFMTSARGDDKSRAAISIGDIATPWASESGADGKEYDDGKLHYMAATITATDITLYIDGELISTTALSETNKSCALSQNLAYLAKGGYGGDPEWIGQIHEFSIFKRALSELEVFDRYLLNLERFTK